MAKPKLIKTAKDKDLFWYKDSEGKKKFAYRYRYYDSIGKRKEKSQQGFNTEKEALRELLKVKTQVVNGHVKQVSDSNLDIATWCDMFLESKKQLWKPNTYDSRARTVRLYIKPLLGSFKLSKLDTMTYQRVFINVLSTKLSPGSVKSAHKIFSTMINAAVENEIIPRNRFSKVSIKKEYEDIEANVLSVDQLKRFLDLMKQRSATQYTIAHLLAFTGMRIGEALALTWQDVDLENGLININKSRGSFGVGTPKTLNSYRTIPIDETVVSTLKKYSIYCKELKFSVGIPFKDDAQIFISHLNLDGIGVSSTRSNFNLAGKILGFHIQPHTLRHTHATILIASGTDVVTVANRLGDSSEMVLKVYAHASDENKNVPLEVFKNALQM
ncbi:tyrosine-type recombinase/integrase [Viridibacillus arvi]|uniref:site-specific integrase n=1 Tax=Viridibacillus arvi TaxID=263475 RepID=UPI003D2DCFD7